MTAAAAIVSGAECAEEGFREGVRTIKEAPRGCVEAGEGARLEMEGVCSEVVLEEDKDSKQTNGTLKAERSRIGKESTTKGAAGGRVKRIAKGCTDDLLERAFQNFLNEPSEDFWTGESDLDFEESDEDVGELETSVQVEVSGQVQKGTSETLDREPCKGADDKMFPSAQRKGQILI